DTGSVTIATRNVSLNDGDAKQLNLTKGDYVCLSFSDTGTGMDKKTLVKIFDPFFTTKGDAGTGLGLSQVYGFVQQSKGAINVSSKLNEGTKIIIYLPRCTTTESVDVKQNDDSTRELLLTGSETILLVDDKAELRDLLDDILSRNGYKVCLVSKIRGLAQGLGASLARDTTRFQCI
ncbi:MAG: ATP-binding protein, partial [Arenicellales bacterium]